LGGFGNASILGGIGGTLSTDQNLQANVKYEDQCIRELAFDIGVDPRALKTKIQSLYAQTSNDNTNA